MAPMSDSFVDAVSPIMRHDGLDAERSLLRKNGAKFSFREGRVR
jgi:hypothetical protein